MGRENLEQNRNYQPKVRYINGLTIYLANKQAVYITDGKVAIVLERWFETNNFYKDQWDLMLRRLTRNKNITTIYEVWNLAARYDVARHQTFRFPEIKPETKEIKEEK